MPPNSKIDNQTTSLETEEVELVKTLKPELPSYEELLNCVPKECLEKSLPLSLYYMVQDFAAIALLYFIEPYFEYFGLAGLLFWYFLIGMFGFSLFVVGHDCGHGTFSNYPYVNDFFGHICHAPLLAPYWPWQKSHRTHHTYTSHLTKDRGHPWITEDVWKTWGSFEKFYANNVVTSVIRWFLYTIGGVTDGSHFNPMSSMFSNTTERIQCVVSGLACLACASIAFVLSGYSWAVFIKFYIGPVLAQGFWLTMVTYLQHQTEDINVYEDGHWSYVKGQLQTIDRPYGFGIDSAMHHITDGHVAHHLFFTKIPHYHLEKATAALRSKLEPFGVYRHRTSYDFLLEFARLNASLEYLVGQGTGLLNYSKKSQKTE